MKRLIVVLTLVLLLGSFVAAVPSSEELQNDSVVRGVNQLRNVTDNFGDEERWEYLGNEWKEMLLQNSIIETIDGALSKVSFIFKILFGEDYSLSLVLFFVIVFWFVLLSMFYKVIGSFSSFSQPVSFGMSLLLVIILAHLKVLNFLATGLAKLLFFNEGWWGKALGIIIIVMALVVLKYLKSIIWRIGRSFKKSQEEREKWDEKFQRELIGRKMDSMQRALSTAGEGFG